MNFAHLECKFYPGMRLSIDEDAVEQKGLTLHEVIVGYPALIHAVMPPWRLYTWMKPAVTRMELA